MRFAEVTEQNIADAGRIHSESWKASHRGFCSAEFVDKHTPTAQADFLRREMEAGKRIHMLVIDFPVGIVSVYGGLIENLYVLPTEQRKGYGTRLLAYAVGQCVGTPRLWVLNTNEGARRLYLRNGFRITGNRKELKGGMYEMEMRKDDRKYYTAYDERYKTAHARGVTWMSGVSTPIVLEVLEKYGIGSGHRLLEIGCGEGRDAGAVLEAGYDLTATDVSGEAIAYCKEKWPQFANRFRVLDCLTAELEERFDFIFAVAVIHMLVPDGDRDGFCRFIRDHLKDGGLALVCTMGDGTFETQSDISTAFELQERNHLSGKMRVAGTSCRMVSFPTFEEELTRNGLRIAEQGITAALPDFNSLMYAVVSKHE